MYKSVDNIDPFRAQCFLWCDFLLLLVFADSLLPASLSVTTIFVRLPASMLFWSFLRLEVTKITQQNPMRLPTSTRN